MYTETLWPLVVYFAAVLVVVVGMMSLSAVLGQRHQERATGEPYEGGIVSTGSARVRLSVQFYLIAMFFVIFDVEAVFLFAWAVALRELGWSGYMAAVMFTVFLVVPLVYLWRVGALDWGPAQRQSARSQAERVRHAVETNESSTHATTH
jgi:NADH-quinone oxidoreductase subunit A